MKKITYIVLLSGLIGSAAAQQKQHTSFSNSIHDDGKTMSVSFYGSTNNKTVDYDKTFAVAGMSQTDKDALLQRIADSLGVTYTSQPRTFAPSAVSPQKVTVAQLTTQRRSMHTDIDDDGTQLHVKISGTNASNQPVNYDKVFVVKGWSKEKRSNLVQHIVDSLGISNQVTVQNK
ncbi:hypothetical protein HH214_21055 [Mucilaginibacter robiniae]|uniref:DUF541 domain-containing protein n=1 Tax=Mucilaginibacter robiniae TaxID=2728022 RepID=A0A7L5ECN4_9SPHI|nr:hypothetical protein [Mucilaginibacter robiniae]QJD98186.1 hypothetical protein HH214_21055 [Mucilaginibacter robiniae]